MDLELKPLTVENIDLIMNLEKPEKQAEAMKEIIKLTLKGAGATEAEISGFGDITAAKFVSHIRPFLKFIKETGLNYLPEMKTIS